MKNKPLPPQLQAILSDVDISILQAEASLPGIRLTDADVSTITARHWSSVKGVIIDSVQLAAIAPHLALEIGIEVRDD